jgi:hypothetical protein
MTSRILGRSQEAHLVRAALELRYPGNQEGEEKVGRLQAALHL